jgi:CRP-like cAMP-binding protein
MLANTFSFFSKLTNIFYVIIITLLKNKHPSIDKPLEKFFEKGLSIKYQAGETIIRAEDKPQGVYYIKKGFVKLFSISPDGKELTFNIYKPNSYFPIAWVLADVENSFFYEAVTSVKVYRLPKRGVVHYLEKNPESMSKLIRRLSSGLHGLSRMLEVMALGTAENKVVYTIYMLAMRFGKKQNRGKIKIQLPITHQLISSLSALARETVSVEMDKLRDKKIIEYSRQSLKIVNVKSLGKKLPIKLRKEEDLLI